MIRSLIALAFVFSGAAFAHEPTATTPEADDETIGECKVLREACKSAGFVKGGYKEGKGLKVNCMAKIAKGEKVEGVAIDPADPTLKPCMDKMAAHKEKHMEKREARKSAKKAAKEAAKTGEGKTE